MQEVFFRSSISQVMSELVVRFKKEDDKKTGPEYEWFGVGNRITFGVKLNLPETSQRRSKHKPSKQKRPKVKSRKQRRKCVTVRIFLVGWRF